MKLTLANGTEITVPTKLQKSVLTQVLGAVVAVTTKAPKAYDERRGRSKSLETAERRNSILEHIKAHPGTTRTAIAEATNIEPLTVSADLQCLRDKVTKQGS